MYQIAICDDEILVAQKNKEMVAKIMAHEHFIANRDYNIDCYTKSADLLSILKTNPGRYHLLLLDIEMEGKSGLKLARKLRGLNARCSLVYLSDSVDYVFECFDTHPINYLLKPVEVQKLSATVRRDYYETHMLQQTVLEIPKRNKTIKSADLCFAEASQHHVLLHLTDGELPWNGTLIAFEKCLPPAVFCRCHNSFIVNLSFVTGIVRYQASLVGGEALPISKRYYPYILERYLNFLKENEMSS